VEQLAGIRVNPEQSVAGIVDDPDRISNRHLAGLAMDRDGSSLKGCAPDVNASD